MSPITAHRARLRTRSLRGQALALVVGLGLSACGGATRTASPQAKAPAKPAKAALTSAKVGPQADRVLVAEQGTIAMVARDGCVSIVSADADKGYQEMRVRCPRPERLERWFSGLDQLTARVPLRTVSMTEDEDDVTLPAAELITKDGDVFEVSNKADAQRLVSEVRALSDELGSAETPAPGPASPKGWRMVHVEGPAHVFLGGEPARGTFEARVSTSGQYLCEFTTNTDEGPLRASKSGFIGPEIATRAIDEILLPFKAAGPGERAGVTVASATGEGAETPANSASTAAVFERFAPLQDALGDACLPELEPPPPPGP